MATIKKKTSGLKVKKTAGIKKKQPTRELTLPEDYNIGLLPRISLAFLVVILLSVTLYYVAVVRKESRINAPEENTIDDSLDKTILPDDEATTAGQIFYSLGDTLLSYDTSKSETKNWIGKADDWLFQESSAPTLLYRDIAVLDDNKIGFSYCQKEGGERPCGLYTFDVKTKKITLAKDPGPNLTIGQAAWYSADKLAYFLENDKENKSSLILARGGELATLDEINGPALGRGGFDEDSVKMAFSPDGVHLLQIATNSRRDGSDFNTYVYDTMTGKKIIINGATQPEWLNNDTIVYRNQRDGGGIYQFNIKTSAWERYNAIKMDAYNPQILAGSDEIYYEKESDRSVWSYNIKNGDHQKIADKASSWRFVSPATAIYLTLIKCATDGEKKPAGACDFSPDDYYPDKAVVFDLRSSEEREKIKEKIFPLSSHQWFTGF
ncbi:hypothetical protein HYV44_02320 [Candidatus Microgenomates bacterium]|nr:hypothetical protein [Candidatus Microgenomates bacterium]